MEFDFWWRLCIEINTVSVLCLAVVLIIHLWLEDRIMDARTRKQIESYEASERRELPKAMHTSGAWRVATIIMHAKDVIATEYGVKTIEGIADLIDRETHAPELLRALKLIRERLACEAPTAEGRESERRLALDIAVAAIAATEEGLR
jgi:hypothetical protein